MNNLDWYKSWPEDFRETELDFMLLDIHEPKLQIYDLLGSKAHDTSYHKKGKYGTRKEVFTTSPLGMCGKKKCV